jgi:hypothetical protein
MLKVARTYFVPSIADDSTHDVYPMTGTCQRAGLLDTRVVEVVKFGEAVESD